MLAIRCPLVVEQATIMITFFYSLMQRYAGVLLHLRASLSLCVEPKAEKNYTNKSKQ